MKSALTEKGLQILNIRNSMKKIDDMEIKNHMMVFLPDIVRFLIVEDFNENYDEDVFIEKLINLTKQNTYGNKKQIEKYKLDQLLAKKGLERYTIEINQYNQMNVTRIIRFKQDYLKELFSLTNKEIQEDTNNHIIWFIQRRSLSLLNRVREFMITNSKLSKKKDISSLVNFRIEGRKIIFYLPINLSDSDKTIVNNVGLFLSAIKSIEEEINV